MTIDPTVTVRTNDHPDGVEIADPEPFAQTAKNVCPATGEPEGIAIEFDAELL